MIDSMIMIERLTAYWVPTALYRDRRKASLLHFLWVGFSDGPRRSLLKSAAAMYLWKPSLRIPGDALRSSKTNSGLSVLLLPGGSKLRRP